MHYTSLVVEVASILKLATSNSLEMLHFKIECAMLYFVWLSFRNYIFILFGTAYMSSYEFPTLKFV